MLGQHWKHYVAIGGFVAVICLISLLSPWIAELAGGQNIRVSQAQHATSQLPPAAEHQSECSKSENAELCAQVRMADAAESQSYINLVGVILLFLTLGFTGWAALAAGRAAEAATTANVQHEKFTAAQLRPYITPGGLDLKWLHATDKPTEIEWWRISLIWKNSGQTPARNIRAWLSADVFDKGSTPESIGCADLGTFETTASPLGPGQTFPARLPVLLEKFVAVWQGQKDFYYWGWVEYDSFAGDVRRRTETCVRLFPMRDPTRTDCLWNDVVATRFNAIDDECVHKPKTNPNDAK